MTEGNERHAQASAVIPWETAAPRAGDIVHYVSHGTPPRSDGTQAHRSRCRAAIVTETDGGPPGVLSLAVMNPGGIFFDRGVPLDAGTFAGPAREAGPGHAGWLPDVACEDLEFPGGTWHPRDGLRRPAAGGA